MYLNPIKDVFESSVSIKPLGNSKVNFPGDGEVIFIMTIELFASISFSLLPKPVISYFITSPRAYWLAPLPSSAPVDLRA